MTLLESIQTTWESLPTVTPLQIGYGIVTVVVAQLLFWLVRWRYVVWRLRKIPGPRYGLLGGLPDAMRNINRLYDFDIDRFQEFKTKT